jgi:hypothetical protein
MKVSDAELSLLKKIAATSPGERSIRGMGLSGAEQMLLSDLKKRDLVFYSTKKYEKGAYMLSPGVYELVRESQERERRAAEEAAQPPAPPERSREAPLMPWDAHLVKYGYVVIDNEGEAREASTRLEQELKAGSVLGTRGFDKKYYVAQKDFYGEWNAKIRKLLKESDSDISGVMAKLGISEVAARVALELMREQGELIEKKKGVYSLV